MWMPPSGSMISDSHPGIGWKSYTAIGLVSTASGSTTSGVSASAGSTATRTKLNLSTTTRRPMPKKLAPIHPGEVLLADFLEPLGISQYRLAHSISVPPRRINEIVHGTRAITADTALRLARFFGVSEEFWLNLQARHDLEVERDRLGRRLATEVEVFARAS